MTCLRHRLWAENMSFLAIGDIHGSALQLQTLLGSVCSSLDETVIFLGDYVDIGPDSRQVLDLLIAFRNARCDTQFLKGNHEFALTQYLSNGDFSTYAALGGIATIRSYCGQVHGDVYQQFCRAIPSSHRRFIDELQVYFETGNYLFSHSGYNPDMPDVRSLAAMIFSSHQRLFEGVHTLGKLAVCGHYFQKSRQPFISDQFICVDTGCAILSGPLTAVRIPEREFFQVWPDLTVSRFVAE